MTTVLDTPRSSNSTTPAMAFTAVSKRFPDGTQALHPVHLDVHRGEFVSVVGPSGCGKSTLLKIAGGLSRPSTGDVGINANYVGFVFQDATLLPWRTVRRNVELLMELHDIPKAQRFETGQRAIDTVGLTGAETKFPRALSGGMKMRVSLARCLTMSPEVLLFDEPFGALDEITRQRMNEELIRLFVEQQFAALFVTHSVSEAVFMSSRVAVMSGRPGQFIADIPIPFPFPRAPELRYTSEFAHVAGEVSAALRQGHS